MVHSFNGEDWKKIISKRKEILTKEKNFVKYCYKFEKWQKYYTHLLCHSTNSFGNKSLYGLN